ncbi:protein FAM47A-like [Cavia porcellus]|uniref:protein FAM47A-like n=1 Tax=Cavia porcellus TaxID=10141 RepID=UPI00022B560B|nr:protein FAM47A-like [Cavia porcellus]
MVEQTWRFRPWVREPVPLGMTCKPWWKDQLPSKCFAKHKNKLLQFPTSLDSRRWIFVKEGLDDFRKGCPLSKGLITRGTKEAFLPMVAHRVPQSGTKKRPRKPPKVTSLCTTLSSAQQARKAFLHDLETCITQDPSALFSTLEEDVPADFLLKAREVLDPDWKLEHILDYCEDHRKETKKSTKFFKKHEPKDLPRLPEIRQPSRYKFLQEDKISKLYFLSTLPRSYMPQGVRDFCKWVATLGDTGINEEFLLKRFDIGFEFKPTYDATEIKHVNLLPSELKYCKGLKKVKEMIFAIQETDFEKKVQKIKNPYQQKHEKIRYGAWYLKPKMWKKLLNDEPLIDPKILSKAQRESIPDVIEDLYATIAFKDFIINKGYNMPGILEQLFTKKGWTYDKFVTPIPKAVEAHDKVQATFEQDD